MSNLDTCYFSVQTSVQGGVLARLVHIVNGKAPVVTVTCAVTNVLKVGGAPLPGTLQSV